MEIKEKKFKIIVKPNSSKNEIVSFDSGVYRVKIKAPAKDNKANIEIIKFFSKKMGIVRIVSGLKSKQKVIEVVE